MTWRQRLRVDHHRAMVGWWRQARLWPSLALLAAATTGCYGSAPFTRGCTEIGSPAGVAVTVEREVVAAGMAADRMGLTLRICQTDCASRPVELSPGMVTAGQTCTSDDPDGSCSASASPDGTMIGFVDLPTLTAGSVRIDGRLASGESTTKLAEVTLTAEPTYPNGPDCPSGGPQAAVRVTTTGLR